MICSAVRRAGFVMLASLATAAGPAAAQPSQTPPPTEPPPPAPDPAQASYQQGFAALLAGNLAVARVQLAAATSAQDPELRGAARELVRLIDELGARRGRIELGAPPPIELADDDPDEGRTGMIVTTTLASLYAGIALVDLTDVDDVRGATALITGATGVGFAASLFGTRGKTITGGTASAYSLGITLGAVNALLLGDPLGASTSEQWQAGVLGGMAVTGAAGFLYGHAYRPTSGQVSFVGTLATLGVASAGLGLIVTSPDIESDAALYTMTAGLDLGAAAGLALGKDLTWSPGHARLIWLGSLLGGLGGLATGVLIAGTDLDNDDSAARLVAGTTLAGVWGGFALTAHLTRNMRPDRRFADAQVVPLAVAHGAGLGVAGHF